MNANTLAFKLSAQAVLKKQMIATAILLLSTLITASCYAVDQSRGVPINTVSSEMPLIMTANFNQDTPYETLYVRLTLGKITASLKSAPNIRIFIDNGKPHHKLKPGIPEHLGTLAIFPWPDHSNQLPITATFNATRLIRQYLSTHSDGAKVIKLPFVISVEPGTHSKQPANVEILSLQVVTKDELLQNTRH